jgi:hypothetical protein
LTDATLVSSSSAVSAALQRSTSRRISTERWRAGRCCSALTNASRSVSRSCASSAGSAASGSTRASGIGSSQTFSGSVVTSASAGVPAPLRSIGRARRLRPSSMSRQTFVAILYSHDLNAARPSKRSALRHARNIASCTASSASNEEPSIR